MNSLQSETVRLHAGIKLLFVSWTALLAAWLFEHSILGCELASWDGYERSAWGASIWYDIRHFDLFHLWRHTNEQVVWPPLHSWITGTLFVLFGASLETARLVCIGSLLLSAWFLFQYFNLQQVGAVAAAIVSWLLLTASPFIAHHATSIMSELPGLCLVYAVLVSLPKDNDQQQSFFLPGVLLGLLFLYKYNYAGLTYAALFLSRWMQSGFAIKGFITKQNLQYFGIPLLILALWFIPDLKEKIGGFAYFAANNPNARTPLSWESIILYPIRLPEVFFAADWVCYVSAGIMVIGLFLSPKRFVMNPVFTLFWVHFLAAVVHPMKDIRFVFIPMGMWFLLTGISLQWIIQRFLFLQTLPGKILTASVIAAFITISLSAQIPLYQKQHLSMETRHEGIIHILTGFVQHKDFTGLFISHDLFMPPAINFYFTTIMDTLPRRSYDEPQRWSFYYLLQPKESVAQTPVDESIKALRHEMFVRKTNKVIVLQSLAPEKIVNFDLWYGGAYVMSQRLNEMEELTLLYERRFSDIDLLVKVYRVH